MDRMEIGFVKNKHGLMHTIDIGCCHGERRKNITKRLLFKREMMVSMEQNCENFRKFYFDRIVNFEYPQLSNCDDDVHEYRV